MKSEMLLQLMFVLGPTVLGAVWAWFKRKDWLSEQVEESLEAGVVKAWETYGRARKAELAKSENPKFTEEDREKLKSIAKETATQVMSDKGLDFKKLLKSGAVQDLAIKKIVNRLKA